MIQPDTGSNIGCKTLFSGRGKLPLKLTCTVGSSICPATVLNKVRLDFAQNITCRAGQVRVLFSLPHWRFLPNSLATWNGASGYVARCDIKHYLNYLRYLKTAHGDKLTNFDKGWENVRRRINIIWFLSIVNNTYDLSWLIWFVFIRSSTICIT